MTSRRHRLRPGDEAPPTAGGRARTGCGTATSPSAIAPGRGSILRDLVGIRRQVADLYRMLSDDRPAIELLQRSSAVRAGLRATRRRLLLLHVRRALERTLPGRRHARTRRELSTLLESYPRGLTPRAEFREGSGSRNRPEGSS